MPLNLDNVLSETARRQPERQAILGPDARACASYRQLDSAIGAAGQLLKRAGVRPGDCVGLHVPSGREYIIANYAVWRCGACVVPIPVELTDYEKQEICRTISLQFVITNSNEVSFIEPFRTAGPTPTLGAELLAVPVQSTREPPDGFHELNAAFIRFTSGTTGTSKGVVLSHQTIFERIHAANDGLRIGPEDRVVWLLSMSYHFAVSIVGYLTFGATILLPPNHFAAAVLETARRHAGTVVYGSPVHYAWMAQAGSAAPLSSVRLAVSTAMSLDPRIGQAFYRRFGIPVSQALGLIEVGLPCINVDFAAERGESVGRVLPAYRLKLDHAGLGPALKEISFAGPGLLDAYYEPWKRRDDIMPDGWFRTGDIGELDADECLFLRGRSKDVITVAGMKFFPAEVEAVLKSHPRVRDACVFARRHERLGEAVLARVIADKTSSPPAERDLLDHCALRLAPFKVPIGIEFVEALERTASGKIRRKVTA